MRNLLVGFLVVMAAALGMVLFLPAHVVLASAALTGCCLSGRGFHLLLNESGPFNPVESVGFHRLIQGSILILLAVVLLKSHYWQA